jgi:hypothetical protein
MASDIDRQLPRAGEVFLDHVSHFVSDGKAASRALACAGFAPTPISVQHSPDPDGGAPRLAGTSNVTTMFAGGYLEVVFKTSDTPLTRDLTLRSRAIQACISWPSGRPMPRLPGAGSRTAGFGCGR